MAVGARDVDDLAAEMAWWCSAVSFKAAPRRLTATHHPSQADIALTEVTAALSDPIRVGLIRVLSDGQERGWGVLRAPVATGKQDA
ncbi:hypothetical protein [Kribbella sp. VKM Ac-2568]|uniref:hypothetical protein n=1 Tax=Kribbella sp. VKM Ac-2568 TaxID=2512219 RepID=UPI0010DAB44A|nr:hypothetical protein [Kribbella sp. VKM Ac-2568]TCM47797.1 hypothetical protein EV648_104191 [Kribbella sp. VKM Ac-2568]